MINVFNCSFPLQCDISGTYPGVGSTRVLSSNNIITNTTISNGLTSILGLTFSDSNKYYINEVRGIYYILVDVLICYTIFMG